MKPILYYENETEFITNGIAVLTDATSCTCTEALNGAYEVSLEIPIDGKYSSELLAGRILLVKPNHEDDAQPFRIYSVQKDIDGFVRAKAAHLSYDISGIPVLPFKADTLEDAISKIKENQKTIDVCPFELKANFDAEGHLEMDNPTYFKTLLGGSDSTVVGVYGGEYYYDYFDIWLLQQRGIDRGVTFRYGKDIGSFEQTISSEETYSGILGYYKNGNKITYGNVIKVNENFPFEKIYMLEVTNQLKANKKKVTVDNIDDCVREYLVDSKISNLKVDMTIDYSDEAITEVCLGDTVGILLPEYDIDLEARCTELTFDCLLERNESIKIGTIDTEISSQVASLSGTVDKDSSYRRSSQNHVSFNSLWSGQWSSGSITVDGLRDYSLFQVKLAKKSDHSAYGTSIIAMITELETNTYFRGKGGYAGSNTAYTGYYLSATVDGDTLTFVGCLGKSSSSSSTVAAEVIEIIGII